MKSQQVSFQWISISSEKPDFLAKSSPSLTWQQSVYECTTRSHTADLQVLILLDINVCRRSLRDDKKARVSGIFQSLNAKPSRRTKNVKDHKVEVQARRWFYPAGDMRDSAPQGGGVVLQITQLVNQGNRLTWFSAILECPVFFHGVEY